MNKKDIAAALNEIAMLLELKGENPFKIRSYAQAAQHIERLEEDLETLVNEKRLRELPDVGKALEEKIETLVHTNALPFLDELRQSFPPSIFELFTIEGLGPKRIRQLYDEMDIDSIKKLHKACQEGRLSTLKGFSKTLEKKLLDGIAFTEKQHGKFLICWAEEAVNTVIKHLETEPSLLQISPAGSFRRCKELVKDVDLVAAATDSKALMERFVKLPQAQRITNHGLTKSSLVLDSGIAVDLRVVSQKEYPFALAHFTGSKEHNIVMRQRAKERGWKLNEYGLFDQAGNCIPCEDEAALYTALDLPWIPPELREDRGEFTSIPLPHLITKKDIRGVIHCHTTYSDGQASLLEMAEAARARQYEYLVVCDHSQSAKYAGGLTPERVRKQHEEIDRLNQRWSDFKLLKGIESDIRSDGSLDYDDEILASFDLVLVSVHNKLHMTEKEATKRILTAIKNIHTDILGHMTGRLLLEREGYPLDREAIFDACAEHHVAIEINAHPRRLDIDWRYIRQGRDKGVCFSIGPDAHRISGLDCLPYGLGIARKGWLEAQQVLNCKTAQELCAWRNEK